MDEKVSITEAEARNLLALIAGDGDYSDYKLIRAYEVLSSLITEHYDLKKQIEAGVNFSEVLLENVKLKTENEEWKRKAEFVKEAHTNLSEYVRDLKSLLSGLVEACEPMMKLLKAHDALMAEVGEKNDADAILGYVDGVCVTPKHLRKLAEAVEKAGGIG